MFSKAGTICSVSNCKNYGWQRNSVSQFRFPRDEEICAQWVAKCGNSKLEEIFKRRGSLHLNKSYKVCSKHFAVSDFHNPDLTSQGLRRGAVPSLHVFPLESVPNPETNCPKEKSTSSSKDKRSDTQSSERMKSNVLASKQRIYVEPSAAAVNTTRYASKQPLKNTVTDNKPKMPPSSLSNSKTTPVTSTELPGNLTCASLHCTSQTNNMPHWKFHHFPTNRIRAKLWAINCDRPDLIDLDPQKLHNDYFLCSLHFERNDFTSNNLRPSLSQCAIPTIFHLNFNKSKTSSSSMHSQFGTSISAMEMEPSGADHISQQHTSQGLFDEKSPDYITDADHNENSHEIFYAHENRLSPIIPHPSLKHAVTQTDLPWKNSTAMIRDNSTTGILCRLCASTVVRSQMVHIFEQESGSKQYLRKINQLLPFNEQVAENDSLPQWICNACCGIIEYCDQAVQGFLAANRKLKHLLCNTTKLICGGIKTNKAPMKKTMPCLNMTRLVCRDSVKEEGTENESWPRPIKEEIIDEEQNDYHYECDKSNEQMEYSFDTSQQVKDHNSAHDTESVGPNVAQRKRKDTNVQMEPHLNSASSAKLIGSDSENHVHDAECRKNSTYKSSVTKKKCLLNAKEPQGTVIQSSHTTILTSKDKKGFVCQVCEMLFDSIEAALTHRFKEHSHEEFSNQIQV